MLRNGDNMNHYTFEELTVGLSESFQTIITEKMMEQFRQITGDVNPLHQDIEFARANGFPGQVAFGMLSASFLSTLAGVYLPGEKSLIHSVEVKFVKPVLVGDELTVQGTGAQRNEDFHFIVVKVMITNQAGVKVLRGRMQIGVME